MRALRHSPSAADARPAAPNRGRPRLAVKVLRVAYACGQVCEHMAVVDARNRHLGKKI
jgi:hypothetical protein